MTLRSAKWEWPFQTKPFSLYALPPLLIDHFQLYERSLVQRSLPHTLSAALHSRPRNLLCQNLPRYWLAFSLFGSKSLISEVNLLNQAEYTAMRSENQHNYRDSAYALHIVRTKHIIPRIIIFSALHTLYRTTARTKPTSPFRSSYIRSFCSSAKSFEVHVWIRAK